MTMVKKTRMVRRKKWGFAEPLGTQPLALDEPSGANPWDYVITDVFHEEQAAMRCRTIKTNAGGCEFQVTIKE